MKILRNRGSSEKAKKLVTHKVAGSAVAAFDCVRVSTAGVIVPASADSEVNATVYAMAEKAIASAAMGEVTTDGRIYNPAWAWTIDGANNNLLWLHMTMAKLTETIPVTVGKFSSPCAKVISATEVDFDPEAFSVTEII